MREGGNVENRDMRAEDIGLYSQSETPHPCSQTFAPTWPHLAGRELKEMTLTAQAIKTLVTPQ